MQSTRALIVSFVFFGGQLQEYRPWQYPELPCHQLLAQKATLLPLIAFRPLEQSTF